MSTRAVPTHTIREAIAVLEALPWPNELDGRRRFETNQQHADRISTIMQESDDRRRLIADLRACLDG